MQGYKLAFGVMARNEMQRYAAPHGRGHQLTPDELDARVDVGWELPDLTGVLSTSLHAIRWRVRPWVRRHLDPTPVPSTVAPSPG